MPPKRAPKSKATLVTKFGFKRIELGDQFTFSEVNGPDAGKSLEVKGLFTRAEDLVAAKHITNIQETAVANEDFTTVKAKVSRRYAVTETVNPTITVIILKLIYSFADTLLS